MCLSEDLIDKQFFIPTRTQEAQTGMETVCTAPHL